MPKSKKKYFEIKVNVTSNEWVNMRVAKRMYPFSKSEAIITFCNTFLNQSQVDVSELCHEISFFAYVQTVVISKL